MANAAIPKPTEGVPATMPAGRIQSERSSLHAAPSARRVLSTELFGPAQEIEIEHGQAVYRLRQTSLGKLILTK